MKNSKKYAPVALKELIRYVLEDSADSIRPITYTKLATRIDFMKKDGKGDGRNMGHVLSVMGGILREMRLVDPTIPHLESLVVGKTGSLKGLPSVGQSEFWKDYPGLSRKAKESKVRDEYERILKYGSRWNKVLADLAGALDICQGL